MLLYVLVTLASLLWLARRLRSSKDNDRLPGPSGIPLLGNALQLQPKAPHLSLSTWAQQFGDIYKLHFPGARVVVVSGAETIHEALVVKGKEFGGRPKTFRMKVFTDGNDILTTDWGEKVKWKKKLVQGFIKQQGVGANHMEEITEATAEKFMATLLAEQSSTIDILPMVSDFVLEVILIMIVGEAYDDPKERQKIFEVVRNTNRAFTFGGPGEYLDMFPWLRHFGFEPYKALMETRRMRAKIVAQWIDRCKRTQQGFLYQFIAMSDEEREEHGVTDAVIMTMAWEFLMGGIMTTQATLGCLINILVHHPGVQRELQDELDTVLGRDSLASHAHHSALPYHDATLFEVYRFCSVVPMGFAHCCLEPATLDGHLIGPGTQVWTNLWALHHDDRIWNAPFTFDPSRFIDDNGALVPPNHPYRKNLLPFGAGTRGCGGEAFACRWMLLFLVTLMQKVTVLPEGPDQLSCDPRLMEFGTILFPDPYKVRIELRK